MRAEVVEIVADLLGDGVANEARRDMDRVGDTLRVSAAVAFHHEAVQTEEDGAVVVVWVEVDLQKVERGPRQSEAGFRPQRALESAAQQIGDEARRSFCSLEGDIARETVGDDDVDRSPRELVALG